MIRTTIILFPVLLSLLGPAVSAEDAPSLDDLVRQTLATTIDEHAPEEYEAAAASYHELLESLESLEVEEWSADQKIDRDLLEAYLKTRLFEIETVRLHEVVPVSYFVLFKTSGLFLRPCGSSDTAVRGAVEELEVLPRILENARRNLKRPARVWTENALYQAWYAKLLLDDFVPQVCVGEASLAKDLEAAAVSARDAVEQYEIWMRDVLLPRSDRSPAWEPGEIEHYQFVQEGLTDYGVDEMLRIAREDETATIAEMKKLAKRIHPSGDLRAVWELMKEETPPWPEIEPMARRYVEMTTAWLKGPGRHVVELPENLDYGVRTATPMSRRVLSFGGASYGPTVGGRLSGYYVLTPLEERLEPEERQSRLKSYNPYWTHVISYHEWLGHNVQRAAALAHASSSTPMRQAFRSAYLSQAWSFYLEKLLEDEGYYKVLPHIEALKTRMARLQMRMWRIQRILTKLEMARGEMSFEEAVEDYVEKIGMEPANALIEVQRDSQNPSPPGREIIGERVILDLREEYARRMGEHYELRRFHEALLQYGELPLPVIRRLMLGEE